MARNNPSLLRRLGHNLRIVALTWAVQVGIWLLLAGSLATSEMLAALVAATIGTAAAVALDAVAVIKVDPAAAALLGAWRLPAYILTGTAAVLYGLWKQLFSPAGAPSVVLAVPFDVGGDDPRSAARRALAVTFTTLTPNFIVLGIVGEQGLMLYHQILVGKVPKITCELGAKP